MPEDTPQVLSLDQKRAAYAWECVSAARNILGKDYEKFVPLVKSAPALIMNNGLMQFLAFCRSKLDDKNPNKEMRYRLLLLAMLTWLADEERAPAIVRSASDIPLDSQKKLYQRIMGFLSQSASSSYRLKSQEALELAKWLKQHADAMKSLVTS